MKTFNNINNETMNAANMAASDNVKKADMLTDQKVKKGENFGDLCWDTYGKASVIIFGNIDDHADELEILGGKRTSAKYSALQNGRKWSEKMGRTDAYIFNATHKEGARRYLVNINSAIMSAALRKEGETLKPAKSYQTGDRVNTIHGKGTIIEGESKYSDRCRLVRLDRPTYNYGWEGMPQTFVEVSDENMKPNHEGEDSTAHYRRAISEAAAMGCAQCCEFQGKRVEVKAAYQNGHDNPTGWTYRISWYDGKELKDCENGVTLEQAARALAQFEQESRDDTTLEQGGQITDAPQPSAWVTDYTAEDFAKLTANPEAIECDPDIMGKRLRLVGKDGNALLGELQVFISDYAGNERHAIYYIWDEFMNEVKCNVRPLDWLRTHFTKANGWEPMENSDTFCRHAA